MVRDKGKRDHYKMKEGPTYAKPQRLIRVRSLPELKAGATAMSRSAKLVMRLHHKSFSTNNSESRTGEIS